VLAREVAVLHPRFCRRCGRPLAICCGCDRGYAYGSRACSEAARRERHREAKRRNLKTPQGRANNARHQREYQARRRQRSLWRTRPAFTAGAPGAQSGFLSGSQYCRIRAKQKLRRQ
jgi:hypothetical protein